MQGILDITITDIIQVIMTIANVAIVYFVYKLTKKEVNPKLHLLPVKRKPIESNETDEYGIFEVHDGFSNVVNSELLDIDFEQRGFPDSSQYHAPLVWEIEMHNQSEYVATFVELNYEIKIYKVNMTFGTDEADIIAEKYVPYTTIKRRETFDYLAPNDKKIFKVLYLSGEFIKADLIITKFKSKEFNFISNPIILDEYRQPMLEWLSDSHHHRLLIGSYKPPK